ncbi:polysaccharide deacetylase family protein [Streptomyces sp. NPDC002328]|uniref:polysaccharide deacetylase family protein n=1 Tax=Streptomyces sp. NPDC002328 TaxID=3364642 RepID=UPI0036A4D006
MRRGRGRALLCAFASAAVVLAAAAGCARDGGTAARPGDAGPVRAHPTPPHAGSRPAAGPARAHPTPPHAGPRPAAGPARAHPTPPHAGPRASDEPLYRRWGLPSPLAPAPTPAARPTAAARPPSLPPVVDSVPTRDRVVFLTYDDGAERDPRFIDMVRELRLPVSMFLTDSVAGPAYAHFARLRAVGASLQNHTLDHAALRGLPYAGQRAEICGQQNKLSARFGLRPRLFRPPYGTYDTTTRRAAADCGISAIVLWRASMGPTDLAYTHGSPRLRPGDIIAVDPDEALGPTLRTRTTRLLRQLQQQNLTVGRLEDYL